MTPLTKSSRLFSKLFLFPVVVCLPPLFHQHVIITGTSSQTKYDPVEGSIQGRSKKASATSTGHVPPNEKEQLQTACECFPALPEWKTTGRDEEGKSRIRERTTCALVVRSARRSARSPAHSSRHILKDVP